MSLVRACGATLGLRRQSGYIFCLALLLAVIQAPGVSSRPAGPAAASGIRPAQGETTFFLPIIDISYLDAPFDEPFGRMRLRFQTPCVQYGVLVLIHMLFA